MNIQNRESIEPGPWGDYLAGLVSALNSLPETSPILAACAPAVFQYRITDDPRLDFWLAFRREGIDWGAGEGGEAGIPRIEHQTDLGTFKKINSGAISPIQARMDGSYEVAGDMGKLMECSPILPLISRAHSLATGSAPAAPAKPAFRHSTDLRRLRADIAKAAELADAPYDEAAVDRVFSAFGDFFAGSTVTFSTNTVPKGKRRLALRYVEFQVPHDPYAMALEAGLLERAGHPVESLMRELQAGEDILGYGTDLAVEYGIAKIWVFLRRHPELKELCARLPSLPAGLRGNLAFFDAYGLRHVSLIALDFRNRSSNVYFMLKRPGALGPDAIAAALAECGLRAPSPELLGHCAKASICYFTFTWDSPRVERACFCVAESDPAKIPVHLDPMLERYVRNAPFAGARRDFIYNVTPTRDDVYLKIENDYVDSMVGMIKKGAQIDPD